MEAPMTTWRRLMRKVERMIESQGMGVSHNPTAMNCDAPAKTRLLISWLSSGREPGLLRQRAPEQGNRHSCDTDGQDLRHAEAGKSAARRVGGESSLMAGMRVAPPASISERSRVASKLPLEAIRTGDTG